MVDSEKLVTPLGYRALIKPIKEEKIGKLVLPEAMEARGVLGKGEIVKLGKSNRVKVGDKVYYRKVAGDIIDIGGEEYSLVRTKWIRAKYSES